jgi:hypothetical protein
MSSRSSSVKAEDMRSMAGGFRKEYLPILEDMFTTLGKNKSFKTGQVSLALNQLVDLIHVVNSVF